jgi:hypothetical protein
MEKLKMINLEGIFEDIIESETENDFKEVIDFSSPEDVLINVICLLEPHDLGDRNDWKNYSIESCTIISGKEGVTGAASYDSQYGGFLDYTIQSMTVPLGEGWFVVEGITGIYHKGDGWDTDDDMDFDYVKFRPASEEEIKLA